MSDAILDDILTPAEAAQLLKMDSKRLLKLARCGEIPAKKIGRGDYRFKASLIRDWLENWQGSTYDPNKRAGEIIGVFNGTKKKRI